MASSTTTEDNIQELIHSPIKTCIIPCGETLAYKVYNNNKHGGDDNDDGRTKYTLVVIAGFGGDSTHLAAELAILPQFADHCIIGINPRGWGTSTQNTANYTYEENSADIKAVIDYAIEKEIIKLKRKKKVMVLGHSTGGPIAALLAIHHPEIIKAAFLMNSVPIHGMRYPEMKEDGTPTGKVNTTKEQFDNHTKFIQSAGFLSSDEETVHKAWGVFGTFMPEVGSSAMKRFHDGIMNFRALSANTCNARFNITPIATVNANCSDILKEKLQVPINTRRF